MKWQDASTSTLAHDPNDATGQCQLANGTGWLQDCNSMLVSALCNLAAMVALGL